MKQGGKRTAAGFTIVETLIVLAVTGMLFVSAVALINGRQNRTQFTTAINNLQQQLQLIINETTSGYYRNNADFSCTKGLPPAINNVGNSQGTNSGCTFLGTVIYFGPGQKNVAAGQPLTQFTIYPIAGNRVDSSGHTVADIPSAWPVALAPGNTTNTNTPDNSTVYTMEGGLSYVGQPSLPLNQPMAIGIISSLGGDADPSTTGSQQFRLYGFGNSWAGVGSPQDVVDKINTATTAGSSMFKVWPSNLRVCIVSGGTTQSGLITVSQSLRVTLDIKGNTTCA